MLKRKYCVAFINDTTYINEKNIERMQNLLSYWYMEMGYQVKVKAFTYYESALIFGRDWGYENLICVGIGNDLEVDGKFIEKIDSFLTETDYLVGHILDKKERYYELHKQCFYINAKKWGELGSPYIGYSTERSSRHKVERCHENHHDDYTPHYIKQGVGYKEFKNLKFGHNLIHTFISDGQTIRSFDDTVRHSKFYCYPEDKEFDERYKKLINYNFVSKYYLFNTEQQPLNKIKKQPLIRFSTVCAGLNHLKLLWHCGYTSETVLRFFDWDKFSIELMKHLYDNWDGTDYLGFVYNYQKNNTHIVGDDKDNWNNFVEYFGSEIIFSNWFVEMKKKIKVEFVEIDMMNTNNKQRSDLFEFFNVDGNKMFWLSNIFHYKPTSILYGLPFRAAQQDLVIGSLPKDETLNVFSDSCLFDCEKLFNTEEYIPKKELSIGIQERILT